MSGILPNIALTNNFDKNGELMRGALLRIYAAGTTTPVTAYKDSDLTPGQEHPWPLEADSAGAIPYFWVADGVYRARLSSADGSYVRYDIPAIEAVGAASSEGGGGGGSGVSSEVIFQTGDTLWRPSTGQRPGWVRINGRTIGSAASGATERAAADAQPLFEWHWNNFDNTTCPVSGGRGASAAADFAANKTIQLLDMRGRAPFGLDTMGNSAASRITDTSYATPTAAGSAGGAAQRTLTQANLPDVDFEVDIPEGQGSHHHAEGRAPNITGSADGTASTGFWLGDPRDTANATLPAMSGTAASGGSGTAINIMPPGMLGTWYQKL